MLESVLVAILKYIEELLNDENVLLWLFYLILFLIVLNRLPHLSRYRVLGFYGLVAAVLGGALLFCLTPAGVKSFGDLLELGGLILLLTVMAVVGFIVMRVAFSASRRQKRFEREVDRFHDAWKSRNERW